LLLGTFNVTIQKLDKFHRYGLAALLRQESAKNQQPSIGVLEISVLNNLELFPYHPYHSPETFRVCNRYDKHPVGT
jgi:hypothetical protein